MASELAALLAATGEFVALAEASLLVGASEQESGCRAQVAASSAPAQICQPVCAAPCAASVSLAPPTPGEP